MKTPILGRPKTPVFWESLTIQPRRCMPPSATNLAVIWNWVLCHGLRICSSQECLLVTRHFLWWFLNIWSVFSRGRWAKFLINAANNHVRALTIVSRYKQVRLSPAPVPWMSQQCRNYTNTTCLSMAMWSLHQTQISRSRIIQSAGQALASDSCWCYSMSLQCYASFDTMKFSKSPGQMSTSKKSSTQQSLAMFLLTFPFRKPIRIEVIHFYYLLHPLLTSPYMDSTILPLSVHWQAVDVSCSTFCRVVGSVRLHSILNYDRKSQKMVFSN